MQISNTLGLVGSSAWAVSGFATITDVVAKMASNRANRVVDVISFLVLVFILKSNPRTAGGLLNMLTAD